MFLGDDLDLIEKTQCSVGHVPLVEVEDVPATTLVCLMAPEVLAARFGVHGGDDSIIGACD